MPSDIVKWDYETIVFPAGGNPFSEFKRLGKLGWELVSVAATGSAQLTAFFKRQL